MGRQCTPPTMGGGGQWLSQVKASEVWERVDDVELVWHDRMSVVCVCVLGWEGGEGSTANMVAWRSPRT